MICFQNSFGTIDKNWDAFVGFLVYTECIKKLGKSEIALCFAKRLNVRCFLLK